MHKRSDDACDLALAALHAVADADRIVLADHLAEVAARREMMMQAAVGDEEYVAARNLAVDDRANVDARLADEIAPELDHEPRLRQLAPGARDELREIGADGSEVERLLAREVGDAEAAAEVQHLHRRRRVLREAQRELVGLPLRVADRLRLEVLRSGVEVEAFERKPALADRAQQVGNRFRVDAELLRPAAHLHARGLELEVGIDAHRDSRGQAQAARHVGERGHFACRLDVDEDAACDGLRELGVGLARGRRS